MSKVLLVTNAEWYFLSHRVALAVALREAGHEVVVVAEEEEGRGEEIQHLGFRFVRLPLVRRSSNPATELITLRALYRLYSAEKPWAVHHITIKPVIYGSIVARTRRIPLVINTIPGLGYMFIGDGTTGLARRRFALALYRVALRGAKVRAIFQNSDDRKLFVSSGVVRDEQAITVPGSGVDVTLFVPAPEPPGEAVAVLPARLLWDKGVGELAEASRILRRRGVKCRIALVGRPDAHNPSSVPVETLHQWVAEGVLEWWGYRSDMEVVMRESHIIVLPSYREGVPKVLLEAAAAGRAIITTDVPGCREIVTHRVNGLLVPPRDAVSLAAAIERLVTMPDLRKKMGAAGRAVALERFADARIVKQTLAAYAYVPG